MEIPPTVPVWLYSFSPVRRSIDVRLNPDCTRTTIGTAPKASRPRRYVLPEPMGIYEIRSKSVGCNLRRYQQHW